MTILPDRESERAARHKQAQRRFVWLQITRLSALAAVMAGIAITQEALAAPYAIGVGLAVAGLVAFFFAPPILARWFKKRDSGAAER